MLFGKYCSPSASHVHQVRSRLGCICDKAGGSSTSYRVSNTDAPKTLKVQFNPFDPAVRENPYPFYEMLREKDPVHRTLFDVVLLTRYEDVAYTLKSSEFSRDMEKYSNNPLAVSRRASRETQFEHTKSILNLDPPDHTRLRRILSMSFTSRAVESLRPRVRELVGEVLSKAREAGRMELVGDLALPVPFTVISEMLGISRERSVEVREWSKLITGSLEPTASLDEIREAGDAMASFVEYLKEVISEKKRKPADDMISSMVEIQRQGDPLTDDELAAFALLLYVAGHETTVNVIGNSVLSLLRNPEQGQMVRQRGIDMNGVDELLRIDAPVQLTVRIPLVPVFYTVGDERIQIEPGEMVMTSLGGANHDPSVFAAPGVLDLSRENAKSHMSFASGIHYCMGAGLARMQAQEVLGALFQAFSEINVNGDIQWRDRLTLRGVERLELGLGV